MKPVIKLSITLILLSSLSACNTVKGAGKDLQGAGRWVVDSVNNAQGKAKPAPAHKGKYQYPNERRPSN